MPIVVDSTAGLPTLAEVKQALGISLTNTTHDVEMQRVIDAAVRAYQRHVGKLGTQTVRLNGGTALILPPTASAVTAVAYSDGTAVDVADLEFDAESGILRWDYNTAGVFTAGSRNVLVTYTGSLPEDHRHEVVSDVAGYWSSTQRGGSSGPRLPGEGFGDAYEAPGIPLTSFPRILALGRMYGGIA